MGPPYQVGVVKVWLLHIPDQKPRRQHVAHFSLSGPGHKTNAGGRRAELCIPHPWVSTLQDALEICLPLLRVGGEGAAQALQVHQEQSEHQAPGEACGKAPPGPGWEVVGMFLGYVGRPGTEGAL